ncbi:ABC transporter permease [Thermoanaerobacter sp. RKWS2]|uniref:ABC transporter permease n=1 Tax=Thermoanaerobacter sp. RKWS2 TaxID=2983842 RepID=UPI00224B5198|nr:ABC transporter permease [Thermoanaerobacter sp. RKWS2]UZQ82826.1 ABC transporter permease [Thermoanaerobacter sp. RKWS2]
MFKLIKYELQGRSKYYIAALIGMFFMFFYINMRLTSKDFTVSLAFSFLAIYLVYIVLVISGIILYAKDVFGNSGYLIFTIPKRGETILGAKLIVAIAEFLIFMFTVVLLSYLNLSINYPVEIVNNFILEYKNTLIPASTLITLFFIFLILLSYFSITLTKTIFYSNKYAIWISLMLMWLIYFIINKLITLISKLFPYSTHIGTGSIIAKAVNTNSNITMYLTPLELNIAALTFETFTLFILFIATSYLIDSKMNL